MVSIIANRKHFQFKTFSTEAMMGPKCAIAKVSLSARAEVVAIEHKI